MIRKCAVCGAEFKCSPTDKILTCSKKCSSIRRSTLLKGRSRTAQEIARISAAAKKRGYTENLRQGTPAAQKSPKGGRFATNSSARDWVLISPDGMQYKCTNLLEFIRQNGALFGINGGNDEEAEKIYTCFTALKSGIKAGKSRSTCCGGWKIQFKFHDKKNCEK